ncbi:MAG: SsrA-binding protein SmpB [Candidatus Saganbacteria bacterium]|nr:SsrA-binding protein SmpB [Candidatus Saganbacteria bacterium]
MAGQYYKVIINNRKAFHDFFFQETFKAGIVLQGSEVKSIRMGRANFKDSFARLDKDELWLYNMHISPYGKSTGAQVVSDRVRKILVTRGELKKISGKIAEKGMVAIPTKLFLEGNWVKVEIGLGKAKKRFEKRDTIMRKVAQRDIERALKETNK